MSGQQTGRFWVLNSASTALNSSDSGAVCVAIAIGAIGAVVGGTACSTGHLHA